MTYTIDKGARAGCVTAFSQKANTATETCKL